MRCNKCGEEYKDNQAFCLKCGNPIHVVPDFNLIEAGLASDVEALMDSDNENVSNGFDEAEAMKTVNVPVDDISMELKMVDISRGRFNFEEDSLSFLEEKDEEVPVRKPVNRPTNNQTQQKSASGNRNMTNVNVSKTQNTKSQNVKASNSKKSIIKNVFIMLACMLAVAFVVVILKNVVFSDNLNDSNNFKEQYNIAKEHYDNNSKREAIDESKKAIKIAYSTAEVLKARKLLHDVYVHFEVFDGDYEENLLKIIELDSSNNKYNEALLDYYYSNKKFIEFNSFFATLEGKGTTDNMTKYLPAKPVVSLEGGRYDTFLNVEITAVEGAVIYYTLDGKDPKNNENAFTYVQPIELNAEGTTVILAYAKDANGIMSETIEVEYIIEDVEVSGPIVTPSSGAYSEHQKVTVTVPEGATVYYTIDGTDPTTESIVYTEPFDMPYGRTDYKFISIDANGMQSNITSITYSLSLERNVTITEAETLVKDKCIEEKELDADAKDKDGLEYKFVYKDRAVLNNGEYYIIEVSVADQSKETEYYAVNTNDTTIVSATKAEEGYTITETE